MNYREQQLRQIIKNNYVPKTHFQQAIQELSQENQGLKKTNQDLIILAEQRKEELEKEKSTLKETQELLAKLEQGWQARIEELEQQLNQPKSDKETQTLISYAASSRKKKNQNQ